MRRADRLAERRPRASSPPRTTNGRIAGSSAVERVGEGGQRQDGERAAGDGPEQAADLRAALRTGSRGRPRARRAGPRRGRAGSPRGSSHRSPERAAGAVRQPTDRSTRRVDAGRADRRHRPRRVAGSSRCRASTSGISKPVWCCSAIAMHAMSSGPRPSRRVIVKMPVALVDDDRVEDVARLDAAGPGRGHGDRASRRRSRRGASAATGWTSSWPGFGTTGAAADGSGRPNRRRAARPGGRRRPRPAPATLPAHALEQADGAGRDGQDAGAEAARRSQIVHARQTAVAGGWFLIGQRRRRRRRRPVPTGAVARLPMAVRSPGVRTMSSQPVTASHRRTEPAHHQEPVPMPRPAATTSLDPFRVVAAADGTIAQATARRRRPPARASRRDALAAAPIRAGPRRRALTRSAGRGQPARRACRSAAGAPPPRPRCSAPSTAGSRARPCRRGASAWRTGRSRSRWSSRPAGGRPPRRGRRSAPRPGRRSRSSRKPAVDVRRDDDRQHAVLEAVAAEDVGEAGRQDGPDAPRRQRPRRVLARGARPRSCRRRAGSRGRPCPAGRG